MKHGLCAIMLVMLLSGSSASAGEPVLQPILSAGQPAVSGRIWRGVFEPLAQAVIASEVSMPVASMPKQPGDSCEKGDILVEFDSTLPDAAIASAESRLAAAESRLAAAELNRTGMQSLFERNQVTAVELARSETETATAQLEQAVARLELAAARREAAACRIAAPFAGKLVDHRIREHEWASKGAALLLLVDDSVLRARFFLPEEYFSTIRVGDPVLVTVPAASRSVRGTVSRLGVIFDPVSRTFDVWADVPNVDDALRTGMTAEVEWPVAGEPE